MNQVQKFHLSNIKETTQSFILPPNCYLEISFTDLSKFSKLNLSLEQDYCKLEIKLYSNGSNIPIYSSEISDEIISLTDLNTDTLYKLNVKNTNNYSINLTVSLI